jgi:hypothetical protein
MRSLIRTRLGIAILMLLFFQLPFTAFAQTQDVQKRLKGFDQYMEKVLKDWNTPVLELVLSSKISWFLPRGMDTGIMRRNCPSHLTLCFKSLPIRSCSHL